MIRDRRQNEVVLSTRIYTPETGAAPLRLTAVVAGLKRAGYATRVVTTQPVPPVNSTAEVRRMRVLRDAHGVVRGYLPYLSFDIPLFFRLMFSKRPSVYIAEAPPTTGIVTMIVSFIKRRPYIYFAADVWHVATGGMGASKLVQSIVKWAEETSWKNARAIFTVTEGISGQIRESGIDAGKIRLIGSGIDTDLFTPNGKKAPLPPRTFVYAGTMSEFQGAEVFIRGLARAKHTDATIRFFGQGTELDMLKELADELVPGRVEFCGIVSPETVAEHLRASAGGLVSLNPAANYDFVVPTKSLVAVSCGTPVIYAGPGPFTDVIRSERLGWAAEWTPQSVADALDAACAQPIDTDEAQRLHQIVLERYSLSSVADRAAAVVDGVIP